MFKKSGHYGLARRPGTLTDISDGYAVRILDDAHSPRYEPGWLAHVNPTLPLVAGKDVIVRLQDNTGVVGTLVSETPSSLLLSQFNRDEQLALLKTNIKSAHRIVGSDQE